MTPTPRIALLADVHANREALAACLEHAGRWHADRFVFLGDLVGYGADPRWVLDKVMSFAAAGAVVVRGNHDEAVLEGPRKTMNDDARHVVGWTRDQLDAAQLAFLDGLPRRVEDSDCLYVHDNAWAPGGWDYVTGVLEAGRSLAATRCRYTFCGHVHDPALYHVDTNGRVQHFAPVPGISIPLTARRRWLAIPGSVGQPRDGVPAACYALFDASIGLLSYFRVPFDTESAARKVRAAGLPQRLGDRLESGL